MFDVPPLPDDLETCQQQLRELHEAHRRLQELYRRLQEVHEELLSTCGSMQDSQTKLEQEKETLEQTIKELMHRLYGRRSERTKYSPDQMSLDFPDGGPVEVVPDISEDEAFVEEYQQKRRRRRRRKKSGGRFPDHYERRTERVEPKLPEGVTPEDCELIGVDVVEILELERPRIWVQCLEYPKYKIPSQPDLKIVQAPRRVSLIPGGSFGFSVAAEVLFNKFALHVPLYRQQDPFAQLGWAPSRSTLGQIVGHSARLLRPLAKLLKRRILASGVVNTDDTPVTLLTPGQAKGSRQARFWIYRSRQAGACYDAFAFTDDRTRAGPDAHLQDFQGTICGDCYSGYVNIEDVTDGRILFSACHAHARRYVFNAREQHPELSSQILAIYRALYDIEDRGRLLDPVARLLLRRRESVPLMRRLELLLQSPAARGLLPKSKLAAAINYLRNHWEDFKRFLSDGRLPIDNNDAERDLRRIAVGRKNWLFVGSHEGGDRTAVILTVIASAHRHDLDVWAYLRDVLQRLAEGEDDLESLLPDVWKAAHPDHVRTFREEEKDRRADDRRYRRAKRRIAAAQS
ncbi:MAG: IS66 family transposase [Planctomycetes bacterium]|nr:IS66 family transposase [Planctomycetota bacterium]